MCNSTPSSVMTLFDVCENRHKGNSESIAAHAKVDKTRGQIEVIEALKFCPRTSKELAEYLNRPLNAISGRLSELKMLGIIEATGERRAGAAELRLI